MRAPWTHEELAQLLHQIKAEIEAVETESPEIRGLPPMSEGESLIMIHAIFSLAKQRALTVEECFLAGQFLASYRMGVEARMLGKLAGRYFVISESDLEEFKARA